MQWIRKNRTVVVENLPQVVRLAKRASARRIEDIDVLHLVGMQLGERYSKMSAQRIPGDVQLAVPEEARLRLQPSVVALHGIDLCKGEAVLAEFPVCPVAVATTIPPQMRLRKLGAPQRQSHAAEIRRRRIGILDQRRGEAYAAHANNGSFDRAAGLAALFSRLGKVEIDVDDVHFPAEALLELAKPTWPSALPPKHDVLVVALLTLRDRILVGPPVPAVPEDVRRAARVCVDNLADADSLTRALASFRNQNLPPVVRDYVIQALDVLRGHSISEQQYAQTLSALSEATGSQ